MLLTITNRTEQATDLGYLLHKNPERVRTVDLTFGQATVFYPKAEPDECTAAVLLEIDPVGLVRGRGDASLKQYVNDRPYCGNSFMCVALGRLFGTALGGRCKDRPTLVAQPLALEVGIPALPCRGGEQVLRRLFEPLGYALEVDRHLLDPASPDWGDSRYYAVKVSANVTVQTLLQHLTVLIPVLDDDKHYWIGNDEVDKLLRRGELWLAEHPEKELISRRYLQNRRGLVRQALAQLMPEDAEEIDEADREKSKEEDDLEKPISLNEQRYIAVMEALKSSNARRVIDLGCGEGKFLHRLFRETTFEHVAGMDVSPRSLEIAARRLRLEEKSERQRKRIALFQGSLLYRDDRIAGFDAACVVEVIEHQDPPRLAAFTRTVFECARPRTVIVTTPNIEYNVRFETLAKGKLRHGDHRFEWTRDEFRSWANTTADAHGYTWEWSGIGEDDAEVGPPTQMAIFTRNGGDSA